MKRARGTFRTAADSQTGDEGPPLSSAQLRELKRRIKDLDDPIRYIIRSAIAPRFELFYHVETGCYAMELAAGTAFKRRRDAEAVIRALGKRANLTILVVKRKGEKLVRVREPEAFLARVSPSKRRLATFNERMGWGHWSFSFAGVNPGIDEAMRFIRGNAPNVSIPVA